MTLCAVSQCALVAWGRLLSVWTEATTVAPRVTCDREVQGWNRRLCSSSVRNAASSCGANKGICLDNTTSLGHSLLKVSSRYLYGPGNPYLGQPGR